LGVSATAAGVVFSTSCVSVSLVADVFADGCGMGCAGTGRSGAGAANGGGPLWPMGPKSQSQTPCVWWQPTVAPRSPSASRIANGRCMVSIPFVSKAHSSVGAWCADHRPNRKNESNLRLSPPRHPIPGRTKSTRRCSRAKVLGPALASAPPVDTLHGRVLPANRPLDAGVPP
jgi:hypothetical protein